MVGPSLIRVPRLRGRHTTGWRPTSPGRSSTTGRRSARRPHRPTEPPGHRGVFHRQPRRAPAVGLPALPAAARGPVPVAPALGRAVGPLATLPPHVAGVQRAVGRRHPDRCRAAGGDGLHPVARSCPGTGHGPGSDHSASICSSVRRIVRGDESTAISAALALSSAALRTEDHSSRYGNQGETSAPMTTAVALNPVANRTIT